MFEERITQTNSMSMMEERQETTLRPQRLDDFIGQKNVKEKGPIWSIPSFWATKDPPQISAVVKSRSRPRVLFCFFIFFIRKTAYNIPKTNFVRTNKTRG